MSIKKKTLCSGNLDFIKKIILNIKNGNLL